MQDNASPDETPAEGRPFDTDPENPGDKTDHDRWLRENVPPHHR
jgi:hypothetical protein